MGTVDDLVEFESRVKNIKADVCFGEGSEVFEAIKRDIPSPIMNYFSSYDGPADVYFELINKAVFLEGIDLETENGIYGLDKTRYALQLDDFKLDSLKKVVYFFRDVGCD